MALFAVRDLLDLPFPSPLVKDNMTGEAMSTSEMCASIPAGRRLYNMACKERKNRRQGA